MDINYTEKNGYLYPDIQISNDKRADERPLGKYGLQCLAFLKEHHPDRYHILLTSGELMSAMHKVNYEAHEQIGKIVSAHLKKDNLTSDTLDNMQKLNLYYAMAEAQIVREYVLIPR